jgi:hypothetical protein
MYLGELGELGEKEIFNSAFFSAIIIFHTQNNLVLFVFVFLDWL